MNEQDTNKVTVALANSFLQTVTVQQTLLILQEKALDRAKEEVEGMDEQALQELLTNVRAQEIAQELRESEGEGTTSEELAEESVNEEDVSAEQSAE
jgi:hypothetical protein